MENENKLRAEHQTKHTLHMMRMQNAYFQYSSRQAMFVTATRNGNRIEYASEIQTNNKITFVTTCPTYFCLSFLVRVFRWIQFSEIPLVQHIFHIAHSLFVVIIISACSPSLSLSLSFSLFLSFSATLLLVACLPLHSPSHT